MSNSRSVYRRPGNSSAESHSLRLPHLKKLRHEENIQRLQQHDNREWLKRRGKGQYIDFDNAQRSKLKKVFKELDKEGVVAVFPYESIIDSVFEETVDNKLSQTDSELLEKYGHRTASQIRR